MGYYDVIFIDEAQDCTPGTQITLSCTAPLEDVCIKCRRVQNNLKSALALCCLDLVSKQNSLATTALTHISICGVQMKCGQGCAGFYSGTEYDFANHKQGLPCPF